MSGSGRKGEGCAGGSVSRGMSSGIALKDDRMDSPLSICWFRQDLRLADNPALVAAAARGQVLPVYVLDDENAGADRMGAASRWWLHHALSALDQSLDGKLYMVRGDAKDILPALAARVGATAVFWNRAYEPWRIARDTALKSSLEESGIEAVSSNGALLWEPWSVRKDDGTPYKKLYDPRKVLRSAELSMAERLDEAFADLGSIGN